MVLLFLLLTSIWTLHNVQGFVKSDDAQLLPGVPERGPRLERITNGNVASRGELPWQAFLQMDRIGYCGGSLVAPQWVLTAAHCVEQYTKFEIYLGAANISDTFEDGRIKMQSTKKIVHPDFNRVQLRNDVALIKLPIPVTMKTDYISTIRLSAMSDCPSTFVGKMATAGGWGRTADNATVPIKILHKVSLRVIPNEVCSKVFKGGVQKTNICCSGEGGRSVCQGDSGGALTIVGSDGLPTQIGIASFVAQAGCTRGHPSVFVRVDQYLSWIKHYTGGEVEP